MSINTNGWDFGYHLKISDINALIKEKEKYDNDLVNGRIAKFENLSITAITIPPSSAQDLYDEIKSRLSEFKTNISALMKFTDISLSPDRRSMPPKPTLT